MEHITTFFENVSAVVVSVGGVLSAIIVIIYFFNTVINPFRSKLEVLLTKDLFFRLTHYGEIFFPKIIVYSPLNMQITGCSFELKGYKEETQATSYNCKAEEFGSVEKFPERTHFSPSHYWPRKSPDFLLKKDGTKEILIQCSILGSQDAIKTSIADLKLEVSKILRKNISDLEKRNQLIQQSIDRCANDIHSNIKIESGEHTLICKITYQYRHLLKIFTPKTSRKQN